MDEYLNQSQTLDEIKESFVYFYTEIPDTTLSMSCANERYTCTKFTIRKNDFHVLRRIFSLLLSVIYFFFIFTWLFWKSKSYVKSDSRNCKEFFLTSWHNSNNKYLESGKKCLCKMKKKIKIIESRGKTCWTVL